MNLQCKITPSYEFTSLIIVKKKEIKQTLHKLIYKKLLQCMHKNRKQEPQ